MSTFDYGQSREMAYRLVDKFGTDCKVRTSTRVRSAQCVFINNSKQERVDSPVQLTTKRVYLVGVDLELSVSDRLEIKRDVYLITAVETYNFDNQTKVLFVLEIAK